MPYKNHLPFLMLSGTVWSPASRKYRWWRQSLPTQAFFSAESTLQQVALPKSTTYYLRNISSLSWPPVIMAWNTRLRYSIDRRVKMNCVRPNNRYRTRQSKPYSCWTRFVQMFYLPSAKRSWNSKCGSSIHIVSSARRETLQSTFSGQKRAKLCWNPTSNTVQLCQEKAVHVKLLTRIWTSWRSSGGASHFLTML